MVEYQAWQMICAWNDVSGIITRNIAQHYQLEYLEKEG